MSIPRANLRRAADLLSDYAEVLDMISKGDAVDELAELNRKDARDARDIAARLRIAAQTSKRIWIDD